MRVATLDALRRCAVARTLFTPTCPAPLRAWASFKRELDAEIERLLRFLSP